MFEYHINNKGLILVHQNNFRQTVIFTTNYFTTNPIWPINDIFYEQLPPKLEPIVMKMVEPFLIRNTVGWLSMDEKQKKQVDLLKNLILGL